MSEDVLEQPQVFGGYLLLEALGRGAMGDVFLARPLGDRGIPSPVVVKRLHGDLATKPGFVARFRHEAAIAVSVDSIHVARVYDVGAVGDTLYIALEYVPGWPLSKVLDAVLKSGRHASVASVVDLVAGGLSGLDALHTATDPKTGRGLGIVHRDLSPKNLMVGEDGKMRLIDLGLGKSNVQDWRTRTGVVMGSVGYMPPEQARGDRVDARADVYAMGVVAFEMLALRNYVKRGTISEMMEASGHPVFVRPSEFRPDLPRELDLIIEKALRPDREQRYRTAREFLDALRTVVPPTYTDGGMVSLLQELFGANRSERQAHLQRLLAMPVPDVFETMPTKVYGLREGVEAFDEVAHTRQVAVIGLEPDRTALTELSRPPRGSSGPMHAAAGRPRSVVPAPVTTHHHAAAPRGVSMGMLIAAVLAAALLGGFVAVGALLWLMPPPPEQVVVPTRPAAPPNSPSVTERPAPVEVTQAPAPPPVATPPPRRRAPTRTAAAPPRAPPPPPAAAPDLDADLDRLEARARTLRKDASPNARAEANKVLMEITMWRRSNDADRKKAAVQKMQARLRAISSE